MTYIPDLHSYCDEEAEDVAEELKPIREQRKKAIKSEIEELISDEFDDLEERAGEFISECAASRASRFLVKVLEGDEKAAMELFGDKVSSDRYKSGGFDEGKPWCHLIHGNLFETSGIKLRRQIVEAHTDLVSSERIKDLESIVDGLTQQIRKIERDLEQSRDRFR